MITNNVLELILNACAKNEKDNLIYLSILADLMNGSSHNHEEDHLVIMQQVDAGKEDLADEFIKFILANLNQVKLITNVLKELPRMQRLHNYLLISSLNYRAKLKLLGIK